MPDIRRTPRQQLLSAPPGTRPVPSGGPQPEPPTSAPPPSAPDLTTTKISASAGAAATAAVFGSFFGATGTVAGAALGSVVSTVGASIYQRSLDRTRERVRARVRLPSGQSVAVTRNVEVPAPRSSADANAATVRIRPVAPEQSRAGLRWVLVGTAAVLAFALALLAVTGVEWLTGSTLGAVRPGTSVGQVLGGDDGAPAEPDSGSTPGDESSDNSESAEPDSRGTTAPDGSDTATPSRTTEPPARTPAPTSSAPPPPLDLLPVQ